MRGIKLLQKRLSSSLSSPISNFRSPFLNCSDNDLAVCKMTRSISSLFVFFLLLAQSFPFLDLGALDVFPLETGVDATTLFSHKEF